MSMLPGGQPLHRVLPDLDELLEDPHVYLSEAPLAVGPRRMYGLAALFGVAGVGLVLSCVLQGKFEGERIAMGIGFLAGAGVWLGWSLRMRGHEIVFHPDGVEVVYHDTSVWAPWVLFHVEDRPLVPDSNNQPVELTVPIDPKMAPHVQLRRGGTVVAWGLQVQGPQWFFSGRDEVALPARYEVMAQDIRELILVLGHRLGGDPPRTVPPPEAEVVGRVEKAPLDPGGWITVPLSQLHLPNCCARCGGPRDDTLRLQVMARGDWVLGLLPGGPRAAELPVPVCEACKADIVMRGRNGGWLGMIVGAALGTGLGVWLGVWLGEGRDLTVLLGAFLGFFLGTFAGSLLGLALSRKMPVRVRGYSPSRGLVSVRFENPAIAARVLESIRLAQKPADEPPAGSSS